jgi:hypothetical protein
VAHNPNIRQLEAAVLVALGVVVSAVVAAALPVRAQAPSGVPAVRFYGQVTSLSGAISSDGGITAVIDGVTCGVSTGSTSHPGTYVLDIRSVPGCTTSGTSVQFIAGGLSAEQTSRLPELPGSGVHQDLTFVAAAPTATPQSGSPAVHSYPIDATAICRDWTYSISPDATSACDGHGGIADWFGPAATPVGQGS